MLATTMSEGRMKGPDATSIPTSTPASTPAMSEARLILKSQLEDLALVLPWIEALAAHYALPADTQFAIELCLEEALSNIIRHGYQGQTNQAVSAAYSVERTPAGVDELVFTLEDHAPPFNPLASSSAAAPAPAPASFDDFPPGGQGIRLMRKFASRLVWQQLPNGNRLTLAFALPSVANP